MRKIKRQCYEKDGICHIPLQNGQEAICDIEYMDKVSKYSWFLSGGGRVKSSMKKTTVSLHKFIFCLENKISLNEFFEIIHTNGNELDNRIHNLIRNLDKNRRDCYIGEDGYCHIPLANQKVEAVTDAEFIEEVNKYSWHLGNHGYAASNINRVSICLHRFIFLLKYKKIDNGLMIDHISRIKLDNRLENLRLATKEENARNSERCKNYTGYRGVIKCRSKYFARISVNKKTIHIGSFKSPEKAAYFYDVWAFHYHKDFCILNFPGNINEYSKMSIAPLNYKLYCDASSKFIGVSFSKTKNKFESYCGINYKTKHLGYFDDEVSAAKFRDLFIIKNNLNLKLNFPKETYEQELNQEKQMIVFKTN